MRLFRDTRALFSGDVVWRSGLVDTIASSRWEVIAKKNADGHMIILKSIHGIGQREYATLAPDDAAELGQALLSGAERCR